MILSKKREKKNDSFSSRDQTRLCSWLREICHWLTTIENNLNVFSKILRQNFDRSPFSSRNPKRIENDLHRLNWAAPGVFHWSSAPPSLLVDVFFCLRSIYFVFFRISIDTERDETICLCLSKNKICRNLTSFIDFFQTKIFLRFLNRTEKRQTDDEF